MSLESSIKEVVIDTTRILRNRGRGYGQLEWKGRNNPVTSYDKFVERMVRDRVGGYGVNFNGEEYGIQDHGSALTIYIDPIDGTKNFIRGQHGAGVSVAAARGNQLIAGAVGDITNSIVYFADEQTRGAYDLLLHTETPLTQPLSPLEKPKVIINEEAEPLFETLEEAGFSVQVGGMAGALLMASTAAGIVDGMVFLPRAHGGPNPYDIAAGAYLLARSGSMLTDSTGAPYDFLHPKNGVVAARSELGSRLHEIVLPYQRARAAPRGVA